MAKSKSVSSYQKGQKGENRAAAYLRLRGYRILERNYRLPQGEIDIIVQKGDTLVFVEVKARKDDSHGTALEAVSSLKVKRVSAAAAIYLSGYADSYSSCRFDIVTVGPEKNFLGFLKVRHFENAFPVSGVFNI
ncbi:MAG TPA: YraN family protein [bacterium]|nr:YraN family protein [bacterium]